MTTPIEAAGNNPIGTPVGTASGTHRALTLRRLALEIAQRRAEPSLDDLHSMPPEAMRLALHELLVHQIELEMQNEELRRAELELQTARSRYFDLYDLAPVGYCTIDEQGTVLEANIAAARLLGMGRSDLVGQRISRFVLKADQDRYYLQRKRAIETGALQTLELQLLSASGAPVWTQLSVQQAVETSATLGEGPASAPVMRLLLADISASRLAQAAQRESELRYRTLFDLMDQGYCIIDLIYDAHDQPIDFRYLEVNPAFEAQTGLANASGKRVLELVPDLDSSWFELYSRVLRSGEPIRTKNESKIMNRWFDVYAFRIGSADAYKVAVLFSDITANHLAEDARNVLSQVATDKTARLELAITVADTANRAKSDFLSSMSHELRTPLGAILGFAQLLESGPVAPTASQKRSIDHILQAGWYLLDLINEILDLALVESGKLTLTPELASLALVLSECAAMVESLALANGVTLSFHAPQPAVWIKADRMRIKQVLTNLLSNAIKYNRAGGTVDVTCALSGPQRMRICVADSGAGLAPEQLAQLFQPFNRLGQESGAVQGTGIGLVVCKRLIELMGGSIGVSSTVGHGSLFWIEVALTDERPAAQKLATPDAPSHPLAATPDAMPHAASALAVAAAPAVLAKAQKRLLYIEDNPANLMLVEDLIARDSSIALYSATDGASGIELALSMQPQVILMDINLPGISGFKALELLSANPRTQHIPVLALSANAMPHDITKGLAAGFFRYLTKPIKIDEFLATIDAAFAQAQLSSTTKEEH